jgi:hypothetical protein
MAFRPDYMTGTVTLTSGQTAFTTSGSALQSIQAQAGDSIITKGFILPIATITGQNSGTLLDPCPAGAAGAAQPLRLRFLPDGSRFTAAVRTLVELLNNGTLDALAAAGSGADKLPYYSGAGAAALLDFSAATRALIAAGLGNAATKTVQSNALDTTVGALLVNGAFGLGSNAAPLLPGANADTLANSGLYATPDTFVGSPFAGVAGANQGHLFHQQYLLPAYALQTHVSINAAAPILSKRFRIKNNGVWGSWRYIYDNTNILGAVSQSGGVPTGNIIEKGVSANGWYTRWADGTQICWFTPVTIGTGGTYAGTIGTFPAAFTGAAGPTDIKCVATVQSFTTGPASAFYRINATSTSAWDLAAVTNTNETLFFGAAAFGRWF